LSPLAVIRLKKNGFQAFNLPKPTIYAALKDMPHPMLREQEGISSMTPLELFSNQES
jgi:hypothetical protein